MRPEWFYTQFPPSRSVIENELRLAFWKAGYGGLWFSCTRDEPPFGCLGMWRQKEFHIEWVPGDYLILKMSEPNQDLLKALERLLRHPALAAYRDGSGTVVVEWRAKNGAARLQELETSGAKDLEKFQK